MNGKIIRSKESKKSNSAFVVFEDGSIQSLASVMLDKFNPDEELSEDDLEIFTRGYLGESFYCRRIEGNTIDEVRRRSLKRDVYAMGQLAYNEGASGKVIKI
ncbi:hypothetical protein COV11_03220 [Candidatus Woesearchaeota archaeon CG10_big_fil_rev_8_21_14_0_10_30_7]|nr:MAG: hypothetical protein COV11_03220 [Candidatus Woesearchaeota archaeon CG10_big_fil_rev_8_21_14_0_10_30_7]